MARRTHNRKLLPAIAIIGEGITESIYFSQLRQQEEIQFTVKPDYGKNPGMESIVQKALEFVRKEFDIVFCVIDMDEIINNTVLRTRYEKLKKKHGSEQLIFIENNPCMEFWFLLHYTFTTKAFLNYKQLETSLKKFLPFYEKTEKYLAGNNLYRQLKPWQATARNNAVKTQKNNPHFSSSEMNKIYDYLRIPKEDS